MTEPQKHDPAWQGLDTIVLTGGPQDGRLINFEGTPPHDYRIPIAPPRSLVEPDPFEPAPYGEYLPSTTQHGHIRRNDSGHLIYVWAGIQ